MKTETFFGEVVGDAPVLLAPRRYDPPAVNKLLYAIADGVQSLAEAIEPFTSRRGLLSIRVSEDVGFALGVSPDKTTALMTASGLVRVESGLVEVDAARERRREELTIAALRRALADAVREINEHNVEYEHRTPKAKLDRWSALASGDTMTEIFARLDEAGFEMRRKPTETLEAMLRVQYAEAELRLNPLRETLGALSTARRYFVVDLPRWEDDGGAPAAEVFDTES